MADPDLLMSLIGILVGVLTLVIGWAGNRLYSQLDQINNTLLNIDKELRKELSTLDTRLTVLEQTLR